MQGLTGVTAIAAGDYFTLALKSDGSVWAWGSNSSGQLGDGTTVNRAAPGMVSGLSSVSAIGAGYLHSMALRADGTVWTWGYNGFGQLGDGTTIPKKTPIQANLSQITAIAAGTHHSLALKSDGTIWAWGYNASGQLGDGTMSNRNTPVQAISIYGVSAIAAGANHSLALMADRSVWSWGDNYFGQLGDGTSTNKGIPQQLGSFTAITAIAAGDNHSVVVKDDSSIWISGNNDSGQLGDGTPYSPGIVPTVILGNDNIPPVTTASLGDGTYSGAQTVMLIANEPATIHFTLDGTTPTINSAIYGDPIPLTSSTVLKYFAVDLAGNVESVNTRSYTITYPNPLNIVVSGSGRVDLSIGGSCSGNCSQLIVADSTVILTPVANTGSVFVNWTGCDSVNGQLCSVVMSAAKSVTATFSPAYPLSVNVVESGTVNLSTGGSCTGYCTQNLRAGIQVLLTASAIATVFDGWAGCDSVNGTSCTVTMNGARNVTAIFGYLVKSSVMGYLRLQDAYNAAPDNGVLLVRAADFNENVDLNRNVTVTLSGGYDRSFSTIIGQSTLHGLLTVSAGTIVADNLVIQ
ncbi:MAG: Ig domain-containing [Geobacteraceae bacterium]|nr:MAG: Ig domain-containing [Geobacteraceae bacterium]